MLKEIQGSLPASKFLCSLWSSQESVSSIALRFARRAVQQEPLYPLFSRLSNCDQHGVSREEDFGPGFQPDFLSLQERLPDRSIGSTISNRLLSSQPLDIPFDLQILKDADGCLHQTEAPMVGVEPTSSPAIRGAFPFKLHRRYAFYPDFQGFLPVLCFVNEVLPLIRSTAESSGGHGGRTRNRLTPATAFETAC